VHGRFFPQTSMGMLCKFNSYVSPARWLSSRAMACVTPFALGDHAGVFEVPVTISVDGGADWAPTTAMFAFVPTLQGFLTPDFGPMHGGTPIDVRVPRVYHQDSLREFNQPSHCCFGEPPAVLVEAVKISDTHYRCISPPWPTAPATALVGLTEADGRCQPLPRTNFSYVKAWSVTTVEPSVITEVRTGTIDLLVSGENFRPYHGSLCRFGNGVLSSATVLESDNSLLCRTPTQSLASSPRGLELDVKVAINGVDFIGGTSPVLIHISTPTEVVEVKPTHLYVVGQVPVTVTGMNFGIDLKTCIFGDYTFHREVPITAFASEQQVVCEAPPWMIPTGSVMQKVSVRLSPGGIENALNSTAYVTYVVLPEVETLQPGEGPVEGGALVLVKGRNFLPQAPPGVSPQPETVPLRCLFGSRQAPAAIISDTELTCVAPPVETTYRVSGHLAAFSLQTVPAHAPMPSDDSTVAPGQKQQAVFFYRRFEASLAVVEPLSGPEFGETLVSLRSDYPLLNSALVQCVFGDSLAVLSLVSAYEGFCMSPPHDPGIVEFMLTTNGQNRIRIGPAGSMLRFTYYITPTVVKATPAFGSMNGGTILQLEGVHFVNDPRLTCRFGEVESRAIRFINENTILCKSPKCLGQNSVTVSNNGQNYTGRSDVGYNCINTNQLFHLNPHLGPISGNTSVLVEAEDVPLSAKGHIRCTFAELRVTGEYINRTHFRCVTPSVKTPGEVKVMITLNGQDSAEASQFFLYYDPIVLTDVDPPLGPVAQGLSVKLTGTNFVNTNYLTVRFGGVSYEPLDAHLNVTAMFISSTQIVVELPVLTRYTAMGRVPIYVSNNGQNFSPEKILSWDPDEDSHDLPKSLQYFTFHDELKLHHVDPEVGVIYGGGFVSVYGHTFLNTSTLKCAFEWIDAPSTVFVSATHVMCEVPDMLLKRSAKALGMVAVRVTLNGRDWSRNYLPLRLVGVCPIGHYCAHVNYREYTLRVLACPTGHQCESVGMSVPTPCQPGTFQAFRRQVQCQQCPAGFYCPNARQIQPTVCPRGWICDEVGLNQPYKRCPRGHYCGEGVATRLPRITLQLEGMKPRVCPPGLSCYEGAAALNPKSHNFTTPQPCFQGHFCPVGSATPYGAGACPLGKYCPTPRHSGVMCPERYMCGPNLANTEPIACPAGTFNPWTGQWNCTVCLEGGICPHTRLRMPLPCPCGFECSQRGMTRASSMCPAGFTCDENVATTVEPAVCVKKELDFFVDATLDREKRRACEYEVGQHFVDIRKALVVPEISNTWGWSPNGNNTLRAACCWTSEHLQAQLMGLAEGYRARGELLSERTFARLAELIRRETETEREEEPSHPGFDGLKFLKMSEADWRDYYQVLYPPALSDLMHWTEKIWTWTRPEPCPAGSFCTAGTCPRYGQSGQIEVDFERESQATVNVSRRLTSFIYDNEDEDDEDEDDNDFSSSAPAPSNITNFTNMTCNATSGNCSVQEADKHVPWKVLTWEPEPAPAVKLTRAPLNFLYQVPGKLRDLSAAAAARKAIDFNFTSNKTNYSTPTFVYRQSSELLHADLRQRYPMSSTTAASYTDLFDGFSNISNFTLQWTLARRLAQAVGDPVALISPLSMRAPMQCRAGTFCNRRANNAGGTGLCPIGKFCPPGAGEPEEAPEGVFVTEAGRVRGTQCFPGQFAPFKNTPKCYPCPPGMSCPDFGTTVPFICPPGTYRRPQTGNKSAPSISCEPCGAGTWAPWRGTPDFSVCEPCPEGRVCPVNTGNVSLSTTCGEGYICGEATTPESQTDRDCYDGFYCGLSTTPSSVYKFLCVPGFYCGVRTSFIDRYKFRCPVGFYCPEGTGAKADLDRKLLLDSVYISKTQYYVAQKIAQFCLRQRLGTLQRTVKLETENLVEAGLPAMEKQEITSIFETWFNDFDDEMECQMKGVDALINPYYGGSVQALETIHSRRFLARQLLKPVLKHPADYTNKCSKHDPVMGGTWPPLTGCAGTDGQGRGCPWRGQLECFCTNTNITDLISCWGGLGYPDPSCVETTENTECMDPSQILGGEVERDDFDLMAPHYLEYVQAALAEEMTKMRDQDKFSRTRCPFGTLTSGDGKFKLDECSKRSDLGFVREDMDMIVSRINPVDLNISKVEYVALNTEVPQSIDEENWRPVFNAPARSIFLITFDLRHLPQEFKYGVDWRIKFYVNYSINPFYEDPIECDSLIAKEKSGERHKLILTARARSCNEVELPFPFVEEAMHADHRQNSSFTLLFHPLINCDWRIEVQIINGKFLPDRFMFVRTAIVEFAQPQRADVGSTKAFAVEMRSNLLVELPYNMPLKDKASDSQKVIQWGFLNWLPHSSKLMAHMRHPQPPRGLKEYFFRFKRDYFQSSPKDLISHVPYFSNCRGFGRTAPLWAMLEQGGNCSWEDNPIDIALLDFGKRSKGDICNRTQIQCILDEVPNVKMSNPRWFESTSGTVLFYVTTEAYEGSDLVDGNKPEYAAIPVYLRQGVVTKGELPRKVVISFQYWQKTKSQKVLASGRVYFLDLEKPSELVARGWEEWQYTLEVLYFPMSHFELMVNFAFPGDFYFVLYILVGIGCLGMIWVFWLFHWFCPDPRLTVKPKLFDIRLIRVVLTPVIKGAFSALVPIIPPLFIGLGLIRGEIAVYRLPGAQCEEGELEYKCSLGVLDWLSSSYGGETPVSKTWPGQRRTGRTGSSLAIMGAYMVFMALKLLIPGSDSQFYEREEVMKADNVDEDSSNEPSERGAEPEEKVEKIFVAHLWKRSTIGMLMWGNGVLVTCILQFSYSQLFQQHVLKFLIALYLLGQLINIVFTNFVKEVLLVVPVNNVNQVMILVALLGAPNLFDFLISYFAMLGIQMLNRIYISPNRDYLLGVFYYVVERVKETVLAIMVRTKSQEDAAFDDGEDEDPQAARARADALASAMKLHSEAVSDEEAEDMIGFLGDMSTDVVGNIVTPVFFIVCRAFYHEAKLLYNYNISYEVGYYYVFFYGILLCFQFMMDALSLNIVELYHGWHVLDYFEYCAYRYKTRSQDWKGRGQSYDETVPPHMRSLDQFCFSEQYYFVNILSACGMMAWVVGMQIIFVNGWNIFDDPATPVIIAGSLAMCRATHIVCIIAANYLKIWVVNDMGMKTMPESALDDLFFKPMSIYDEDTGPAPRAPKGSLHEDWPEPSPRNLPGLERYCNAFLQENQLWLQLTFAEMRDQKILTQYREALLRSLAQLLEEVTPDNYRPPGMGPTGFEYAAEPATHLTIAAGEIQRSDYQGSLAEQIMKMWRKRAQFMLFLSRVSSTVKLEMIERRDKCEICGRRESLVVTPIYTMTHLASSYRQQRDMSPLWNMVFWKHFYQKFTPTCTLCERCRDYYNSRNQNVPVDEKRFQRLQEQGKTAYDIVQQSGFQPVPIDQIAQKVLHLWLAWTRHLADDEHPRDFLPLYGLEGRTLAEIRQERLDAQVAEEGEEDYGSEAEDLRKDDEEEELSSEVDEDDPESVERHRKSRLAKLRKKEVSDDEGEDVSSHPFAGKIPHMTWATESLIVNWLNQARENLRNPQINSWSRLPPAPPALAPPADARGSARLQLPQPPPAPAGAGSGAETLRAVSGLPPPPSLPPPPGAPGTGVLPGTTDLRPPGAPPPPPPPGSSGFPGQAPPPGGSGQPGGGDRGGGMRDFMDR